MNVRNFRTNVLSLRSGSGSALDLALVIQHADAWKKTCLQKEDVVMATTEIVHALETAVLERNEDKIFPMNDTSGLTHTNLGKRNL